MAAARQLGEAAGGASASSASSLGGSGGNAALLPHLRNKGLLMFRGHVLLAYGLRRLLQVSVLGEMGGLGFVIAVVFGPDVS